MRVFESNGITSVARLKGKNCNHHSILEMSILKISILFFFIFFLWRYCIYSSIEENHTKNKQSISCFFFCINIVTMFQPQGQKLEWNWSGLLGF